MKKKATCEKLKVNWYNNHDIIMRHTFSFVQMNSANITIDSIKWA